MKNVKPIVFWTDPEDRAWVGKLRHYASENPDVLARDFERMDALFVNDVGLERLPYKKSNWDRQGNIRYRDPHIRYQEVIYTFNPVTGYFRRGGHCDRHYQLNPKRGSWRAKYGGDCTVRITEPFKNNVPLQMAFAIRPILQYRTRSWVVRPWGRMGS